MEDANQTKECCGGKGGCRCRCGGKLIAAIVLLLLGGVIGYLGGTRCGMHKMHCAMSMGGAMSAPMTPPAK